MTSIPYSGRSLLNLYRDAAGRTEIPAAYHTWMSLALISAALGDRVWKRKFNHAKLVPNLYVMLIGPSALGKGEAFTMAEQFAHAIPRIRAHAGPVTAQRLYAKLGIKPRDGAGPPQGKLFLLQEELGMSVGSGPPAKDFIKYMTGLYKAGSPYPLMKGTVGDGDLVVTDHCITFAGGTTREWLLESVEESGIKGGFLGRFACIVGKYNLDLRIAEPQYPPDVDAIVDHIKTRLLALSLDEGEIEVEDACREAATHWYETRPAPDDESLIPSWKREHDLVWKLTILVAKADPFDREGRPNRIACRRHWDLARTFTRAALQAVPELIAYASQTPAMAALDRTRAAIQRAGRIQHSVLMRRLGIDKKLFNEHIATLKDQRRIEVEQGNVYRWKTRPTMTLEDVPPTPAVEEGEDGKRSDTDTDED